MLSKGMTKFPGGLSNRWKLIAEFIGTRTVKEVVRKAKEAAEKKPEEEAAAQPAEDVWTSE